MLFSIKNRYVQLLTKYIEIFFKKTDNLKFQLVTLATQFLNPTSSFIPYKNQKSNTKQNIELYLPPSIFCPFFIYKNKNIIIKLETSL